MDENKMIDLSKEFKKQTARIKIVKKDQEHESKGTDGDSGIDTQRQGEGCTTPACGTIGS